MVKNQHYIPQFYLKRFGANNKIDVYDINNKKYIVNSNVANFACEKYFYDIDSDKIEDEVKIFKNFPGIPINDQAYNQAINNPQLIEETLARLESKMSTYLDELEKNYSLINNENFLSIFFIFIRTLAIRTSGYRAVLQEIATQATNSLKNLGVKKCTNYNLDIDPTELAKIEQLKYLMSLPSLFKKSISFFNNYNIYIGTNNTNLGFIISNEPFLHFELGFNDICFPINPHLAIIMQLKNVNDKFLICHSKPNKQNIIELSVRDIIKYNIFQNHLISKYLFGNKTDLKNTIKIISSLKNSLSQP